MTIRAWTVRLGTWLLAAAVLTAGPQPPRPSRIISVVPAVTEMLFAMGAGDQVVGVSSFETYPPEALKRPQVGALLNPDFERILSLKPDFVVVYVSQAELIARLQRVGVPIYVYRHAGLADVSTTIASLGQRIGHSSDADRLVREIQSNLDEVRRAVGGLGRPRVALVFGRDAGSLRNMWVAGGIGFLHDLVEVAGGRNAFADIRKEGAQIGTEAMLSHAPEIIVDARDSKWRVKSGANEVAAWNALPALPAVRKHAVHLVADDRLFIPGPRVADAARILAGVIHPGRMQALSGSSGR